MQDCTHGAMCSILAAQVAHRRSECVQAKVIEVGDRVFVRLYPSQELGCSDATAGKCIVLPSEQYEATLGACFEAAVANISSSIIPVSSVHGM